MDISYFQKINNTFGAKSKQETELYLLNNHVNEHFADTIAYYRVKKNGEDFELIIQEISTSSIDMKIICRPGQSFETGDYIEWSGACWIVMEANVNKDTYVTGTMKQCTWKLKWQRGDGSICEYWCITSNATQYNSGEAGDKHMTWGSAQHSIFIPCNEDTVLLASPQRFYVSKNPKQGTVYKVTQNDMSTYNYGKGLCYILCLEDPEKCDTDRFDLGICDYINPPDTPDKPITSDVICTISHKGSNTIYVGGNAKTFTALYSNLQGEPVTNIATEWVVKSLKPEAIVTDISENIIKIKCLDVPSLIGTSLTLTATGTYGDTIIETVSTIQLVS